jgi:hypothetical protein
VDNPDVFPTTTLLERIPALSAMLVYSKWFTDKKENQISLIYKEIQSGAVAKSKEEAVSHI